jgi:hypothetical protein
VGSDRWTWKGQRLYMMPVFPVNTFVCRMEQQKATFFDSSSCAANMSLLSFIPTYKHLQCSDRANRSLSYPYEAVLPIQLEHYSLHFISSPTLRTSCHQQDRAADQGSISATSHTMGRIHTIVDHLHEDFNQQVEFRKQSKLREGG